MTTELARLREAALNAASDALTPAAAVAVCRDDLPWLLQHVDDLQAQLDRVQVKAAAPRGGDFFRDVVALLRLRREWTVSDIREGLEARGPFTNKQLYNALGHLVRRGRLTRLGYGMYRTVEAPTIERTRA